MIRKHTLYLGLIGTALSGCGSQYMHTGYNEHISLGDFKTFVEHTRKFAPCKVESRGQIGTRVQYDYGCHGGQWNTSTILVNQTQREVDQIRVLWRERPQSLTIKDDTKVANEFLLAALRYATPEAISQVQKDFFKRTNKQIVYGPLNLVLTTQEQARGEWLHRLVISDTRHIADRPHVQRPTKVVRKDPMKAYVRPTEHKHDPFAQAPEPKRMPEKTATSIMETRGMVKAVEQHTEEKVAPVIVQQPIAPAQSHRELMNTVLEETSVQGESVRIEPQVQHPVRGTGVPQNREERLRNILLYAEDTTVEASKAEKTTAPMRQAPSANYIYDEEAYLKDVEDEVYRQMKSRYEASNPESGWGDLKELREVLEIMEFNMSDEGGL